MMIDQHEHNVGTFYDDTSSLTAWGTNHFFLFIIFFPFSSDFFNQFLFVLTLESLGVFVHLLANLWLFVFCAFFGNWE